MERLKDYSSQKTKNRQGLRSGGTEIVVCLLILMLLVIVPPPSASPHQL